MKNEDFIVVGRRQYDERGKSALVCGESDIRLQYLIDRIEKLENKNYEIYADGIIEKMKTDYIKFEKTTKKFNKILEDIEND